MKIRPDQLSALARLHSILNSRTGPKLLDLIAESLGSNPFEVKRLLGHLEKMKAIKNLHFAGNAFAFDLLMKEPLSADRLVVDYSYSLVQSESELDGSDPRMEVIQEVRAQNDWLRMRVKELECDLESLAKHGKPHQRIVEEALVSYGD